MAKDIAPELIEKVQKAFTKKYQSSPKIKGELDVINKGEATYKNASAFAEEVGDLLAKTFQEEIGKENLPDGRMYYNIADRLLNNTLGKNYDLISSYTKDTQKVLNEKAGIGVKPAIPEINQSRIDHMVERIAEEEDYDKIKWMLDEPVTNFSMAVVDDFVKANTKLHYDLGLHPKIVRKEHGKACSYCHPLAGEFQYPDEVPDDVYRRHHYCRCTVEYFPGDGKKQDVWSKKWEDVDKEEKIQERMEYSEEDKKKIEKERLEKIKRRYLSDYNIVIEDEILDLNPDVVSEAFDGIESMFASHPDIKEKITDIGISNKGIMNCNGNRINFNPLYFSDNKKLKEDCKKMSEIGWWPKNSSPASIAVHEMGHAVNWDLITKNPLYENQIERILDWNDDTTAKKIVSEACKKVKKTEFGRGKKNAELRQLQSGYGATSHAEAIAEAYADVFSNKDNANPLSKAIIDEINDLFSTYAKGEEGQ